MNQLSLVLKEIDAIQQLKNKDRKFKFKILNINILTFKYWRVKTYFLMFGMAIAKCIRSLSISSITNKHRKMGGAQR